MSRKLAALLIAACVLAINGRAYAGDPYLNWYTLKTPRFRVHFHSGLMPIAQRTATLAEAIHARLVPQLGYEPDELTHIVLTDDTDSANGSADVVPFNTIRLFVSAPDDMSALGDYDDWLTELITHEHTHILHVDNKSGIPLLVNAIFGKRLAPNKAQPRWIMEGLAVAMESAHTAGGRLRSTQFDMYLRADVLEDNLASLDQISHPARRWPSGNLWYLYGGRFIDWISDVYGPDTFAAVATDYGQNPIPWGINRSIRRATGRTYSELYQGWHAHLKRRYASQVSGVQARGIREGTRLTQRGRVAHGPRFIPACARATEHEELIYFSDDGHSTTGLYRVPLASRSRALGDEIEIVARSSGQTLAFDGDCGMVFDSLAPSRRRYVLGDLFRLPRGTTSPRGLERSRQRLTIGRRAREPDISPDGRLITYVTNNAGTTTLRLAELSIDKQPLHERRLVPSARFEQAYTPRFSPDGKSIAYSAWTHGGYRDIRIVNVATGQFSELMRDRALDQQPTWSSDGRYLLFVSDRTGISNVYAYERRTGKLHQVTNVKTGAFMPELTPDGKTLFYVGYTSAGFDLFSMPFDSGRWLDAPPYEDQRSLPPPDPDTRQWPVERYQPLATLRPYSWKIDYASGLGSFRGDALTLTTTGSDVANHHAFAASVTVDLSEPGQPAASLDYSYRRLPFDFRLSGFRSAVPRQDYSYGDRMPVVTEYLTGLTTGISYGMPGEFDGQTVSLSYTAAEFNSHLPVGAQANPFSTVTREPHQGFLGIARLAYSYANPEGSAYGISTEKGFVLAVAGDFADPAIGSDTTLAAFSAYFTGYVPMPWVQHHVLALAASGAAAVGTYPRRGLYATGGFLDTLPILDGFTSGVRQGAFVLRGFLPGQFIGSQYNLFNAEYRFPIAYIDRGLSTLPAFFRGISGAVFADYGAAYDTLDLQDPLEQFHMGVGGELWFDVVLGYYVQGNIRVGLAHGLDDQAPGLQNYVVVSSAF